MILDILENADRYECIHPGFAPAFDFLKNTDLASLPDGRIEIDGDRLFAIASVAEGRGLEGAKLEAHRRYIDIQYCTQSHDIIGWEPTSACQQSSQGYDETKDLEFFSGRADAWVNVAPSTFAIYFPEDAHAPLAADGPVHKIVVKVAVDWR